MQKQEDRQFKYLPFFIGLFPVVLVLSNTLSGAKMVQLLPEFGMWGFVIPALIISGGTTLYPVTCVMGDMFAEVYGRKTAWLIIGIGAIAYFIHVGSVGLVGLMTPAPYWTHQESFNQILGTALAARICIGSFAAYVVGDLTNTYVLDRMKQTTAPGQTWWKEVLLKAKRFMLSTVIAQALDSVIFVPIAFAGVLTSEQLIVAGFSTWVWKVFIEACLLPISVPLSTKLKKLEGISEYDRAEAPIAIPALMNIIEAGIDEEAAVR